MIPPNSINKLYTTTSYHTQQRKTTHYKHQTLHDDPLTPKNFYNNQQKFTSTIKPSNTAHCSHQTIHKHQLLLKKISQ